MTQSTDSSTPEKYKAPKWIPWAAFILIGIPLIAFALMSSDREKAAAEFFLDALEDKAYSKAFEMLSDDAKLRYGSPADLAEFFQIDNWITYNRDGSDRTNDSIDASARFDGTERRGFAIYLVQNEQGDWLIDDVRGWRGNSSD